MASSGSQVPQPSQEEKPKEERLSLSDYPSEKKKSDQLNVTNFALKIAQELERSAREAAVKLAKRNLLTEQSTDRGDDPEFKDSLISLGWRIKYRDPDSFKEQFFQRFKAWKAFDTRTRIIPKKDQDYFLKREAKGNLRQYVIWVFIHDEWLKAREDRTELYWRSKRWANEDYDTEIGILVKEKWDLF